MSDSESVAVLRKRVEDLEHELAEWPKKYDDTVQFLQKRIQWWMRDARLARADQEEAIAHTDRLQGILKSLDAIEARCEWGNYPPGYEAENYRERYRKLLSEASKVEVELGY